MDARLPLELQGRMIEIEHLWVGEPDATLPTMVFLHEGLGSVALWKDFPDTLCQHLGMRGLVYSRPGYGKSTARAPHEHWESDFMHRQAIELLPALLQSLNIVRPWLFGHSDGGSISLLYASRFPDALAGAIVLAPHVFVEDMSVDSIRKVRDAYLQQGLRDKLARYHNDVDSAFFGWNDVWLSPGFRAWEIATELATMRCPLLVIQGHQDEYGTMEQLHRIQRCYPAAQLIALDDCGHAPHRDQPERLIEAVAQFVRSAPP